MSIQTQNYCEMDKEKLLLCSRSNFCDDTMKALDSSEKLIQYMKEMRIYKIL